jgi:hypothetical protein
MCHYWCHAGACYVTVPRVGWQMLLSGVEGLRTAGRCIGWRSGCIVRLQGVFNCRACNDSNPFVCARPSDCLCHYDWDEIAELCLLDTQPTACRTCDRKGSCVDCNCGCAVALPGGGFAGGFAPVLACRCLCLPVMAYCTRCARTRQPPFADLLCSSHATSSMHVNVCSVAACLQVCAGDRKCACLLHTRRFIGAGLRPDVHPVSKRKRLGAQWHLRGLSVQPCST